MLTHTQHKDALRQPQKPRVQSVAKAALILQEVAKTTHGIRAAEVCRRTGLPRQATYHLLQTLVAVGLLTRNEHNNYVMGIQIGTLADAFRRHLSPPEYLSPLVRRFAAQTGESCNAVGWRDGEIVTLVRVTTGVNAVQALGAPLGLYEHAHARASGKLLLAYASPELRESYLAVHPLTRETDRTITDRALLEQEFERIRQQGYAVDREEYRPGLASLALPIGQDIALMLSAPVERFDREFERYLSLAREAATGTPKV